MDLRDGKQSILTGEANVFPQTKAAINEINRMEKEYTELFTGKTWKERRYFNYQVIPQKEMIGKKVVLCGFSSSVGPVISAGKGEAIISSNFCRSLKQKKSH